MFILNTYRRMYSSSFTILLCLSLLQETERMGTFHLSVTLSRPLCYNIRDQVSLF